MAELPGPVLGAAAQPQQAQPLAETHLRVSGYEEMQQGFRQSLQTRKALL
jgi:hypothetical protein